jgi:hypothetical protein
MRSVAEELHHPVPGRNPGTLPEKIGRSLDHSHLLRNRGSNPLVQRHAILFG